MPRDADQVRTPAMGRVPTGGLWNPLAALGAVFDPLLWQRRLMDVATMTQAPAAAIAQRQHLRLQRLLRWTRQRSRFYGQRIPANASRLDQVAPVTRAELMAHFSDWVTDPALRLDALRAFVADASRVAEPWLGRYIVSETSGTTGEPGIFIQDARALAVYDALEAWRHSVPGRQQHWWANPLVPLAPFDIGDRHALVVATGGHFASLVSLVRLRRINPWVHATTRGFDLLQPLPELVRALNAFRPTVLATYPTAAALLAEEADAGRLQIAPHCVVMGGENLSPAVRAHVSRAFDTTVRSSYGATEFLPMAWECARGQLHANTDWLILEPVDAAYRPVPLGEQSHTVLLTNLANTVQPVLRYDLGDRVRISPRDCACGSRLPVIEVSGRSDDTFRVPGQREGEWISLLPMALCTVLEEQCELFEFQLCQQDASALLLRIPQHGELAEHLFARCRRALQDFARAQGAAPITVLGEPDCPVPRGRTGKATRVLLPRAQP